MYNTSVCPIQYLLKGEGILLIKTVAFFYNFLKDGGLNRCEKKIFFLLEAQLLFKAAVHTGREKEEGFPRIKKNFRKTGAAGSELKYRK